MKSLKIILFNKMAISMLDIESGNRMLNEEEVNLLSKNDIDVMIGQIIKDISNSEIKEIILRGDAVAKGIGFEVLQSRTVTVIAQLREKLNQNGYQIFLFDKGYDSQREDKIPHDIIAVIKGTDQFDIVRAVRTDGINYGIEHEDVLAKLKEWNQKYPFRISGANLDWVEADFISLPDDLISFAKEVYEFCPDVVDQGVGSVEELAEAIEMLYSLYLWWD
ncbi:DUF4253 domain-containing protein [Paenibacillus sp. WQ 127069]|uniref:DUF4253 domain-containing protein n=1 Tax=Paenibacillus baimaensis TaxID=2982185 RepID=A0ABT2UER6_9BACL|nr:DUF4253 domain-containing protein [Paenibacillus sp. WQ 127069]MCU6792387.1 DUF4253 domain-containing protein [Paenibacillus sp. WQ 127069]